MAAKKPADLSSSLVAVKGKATVPPDATGRQPEVPSIAPAPQGTSAPLNFKVDPETAAGSSFDRANSTRCKRPTQL